MLGDVGKAERLMKEVLGSTTLDISELVPKIRKIKDRTSGNYKKLVDNLLGEKGIVYRLSTRPHTRSNSNFVKLVKNKVLKQSALIKYLKDGEPKCNTSSIEASLKRYLGLTFDKDDDAVPGEDEIDDSLKNKLSRRNWGSSQSKFMYGGRVDKLKVISVQAILTLIGISNNSNDNHELMSNAALSLRTSGFARWSKAARKRFTVLNVPKGVKEIPDRYFEGCSKLKIVTIPSTVKKIGSCAFEDCDGMERLDISNGVEVIGPRAFERCKRLSSVTIPKSVTEIDQFVFSCCYGLKSLSIEGDLKRVGWRAFKDCRNLKQLVLKGTIHEIDSDAFTDCPADMEINVDALDDETGAKLREIIGKQIKLET